MKKTLLLGLIITTAFTFSGCSDMNDYLESSRLNATNELGSIKVESPVVVQNMEDKAINLQFSNVRYEDGYLKYSFTNNGDAEIKYGVLFSVDIFDEKAYPSMNGWVDSNWTQGLRDKQVFGLEASAVEMSIMPGIVLEESLYIKDYIGKMNVGKTYQVRKHFIDRENSIDYLVKLQFEAVDSKTVNKVYAYVYPEVLIGNPIDEIIPEPITTTPISNIETPPNESDIPLNENENLTETELKNNETVAN